MRLNPEHELAPATVAVATALFATSVPDPAAIDSGALSRFAAGLSFGEERERVMKALVTSRELRQRLIDVRESFRTQSKELPAENDRREGAGHSWEAIVREGAAALGRLRERRGAFENPTMRRALQAVGRSIRLTQQGTLAFARGADGRPDFFGSLPEGTEIEFALDLLEEGDLSVSADFGGVPLWGHLDGRRLDLDLIDPAGGSLALASAKIEGTRWEVLLRGFGPATGLEAHDLAPGSFRLTMDDHATRRVDQPRIFASLGAREIDRGTTEPVFELLDMPRVESGSLVLTLLISYEVRQTFRNHRLQILLPIGNLEVLVGEWPVADWTEERVTLRASVNGFSDGTLECVSILILSLLPG